MSSSRLANPLIAGSLVLLAAAGLMALTIVRETPVGALTGTIVAQESGTPLDIQVSLRPAHAPKYSPTTAYTQSLGGNYEFNRVPVGQYILQVHSSYRSSPATKVTIEEGKTETLDIELRPGETELELYVHQRIFTPDEKPQITCQGYVQADTLNVKIYKVDVDALMTKHGANLERLIGPTQNYRYYYDRYNKLDLSTNKSLKLTESFSSTINARESEGNFTKRIDLPQLGPGMYVISVRGDAHQRIGWIAVTSLGLVTKTAGQDALAFVVDLKTGTPVAGADVTAYSGTSRVGTAKTSTDGLAVLKLGVTRGDDEATILAKSGDSFAFVSAYMSMGPQSKQMVYGYTDRPVYRPGQKVFFKGIVRDSTTDGYKVPAGKQVIVEVRDPNDTLIYRANKTTDKFGCYDGQLTLNSETASGNYNIVTQVGGEAGRVDRGRSTADFEVASYSKPEFTAKVKFEKKRYIRGDQVVARIKADYYFGAPVANAKVEYSVTRSDYWLYEPDEDEDETEEGGEYEGYSDYGGYGESVDEGTVTTDENGEAEIVFDAKWPRPEGDYGWDSDQEFTVNVYVTDESRRSASGDGSVVVTRGEFAVSATPSRYVVTPGQQVQIDIQAQDYDRRPVGDQELTVLIGRQFWSGRTMSFRKSEERQVRTDRDGKATLQFEAKKAGDITIVASARDSKGNRITDNAYVWCYDGTPWEEEGTARLPDLKIITDKKVYKPGDTATVLITTKKPGPTALVTVEGDRLYEQQTVELKNQTAMVKIPVRAEYTPNFYISVCYVRNKNLASQEKRVKVSIESKAVNVKIEPNKKRYLPGEQATYKISTTGKNGQPVSANVSLGVVDEAIYAIREESTTPILSYFYSRKPNRVNTSFSFPEIYLSDPDKAGDLSKMPRQEGVRLRKRFEDTAIWQPSVVTGPTGEAIVEFQMPDNLTTWRATARAITEDTRCGQSTDTVLAQQDMLVRLQTPRFLVQGDETTISATVHNYTGSRDRVSVRFSAPMLRIDGDRRRSVRVANNGVERIDWTVRAPKPGMATLTVRAKGSKAGDAMQITIPVYPHGEERQSITAGSLARAKADLTLDIRRDSIPEATKLSIRLAPSLASAMLGSLEYLAQYPYGCTEQTTSSFLPDVILSRSLKDLTPHPSPDRRGAGGEVGIRNPELEKELPDMVQSGLLRLYRFQLEDGGWSWCEYGESDPWMTAYVCYGLIEAKRAGFAVNESKLERGMERLTVSLKDRGVETETKAFGYYVLALADQDVDKNLDQLARIQVLPARSLALLSLAFSETGRRQDARKALDRCFEDAVVEPGMIHWGGGMDFDSSAVETTALALRALLKVNRSDPRAVKIVAWLMHERRGDSWYSTRDTAMTLYAMTDFIKGSKEFSPDYVAEVRVNGRSAGRFTFNAQSVFQPDRVVTVPSDFLRKGRNRIEIRKAGVGNLYYSSKLVQYLAKDKIRATVSGSGLSITRAYYRPAVTFYSSDSASALGSAINSCRSGEVIMTRLVVHATKRVDHMLLEDYIPAGFEIMDKGHIDYYDWYYWYVGRDIRDNKISFYLDELSPGKYVADYQMRASLPGIYHAMPAQIFGMYDPGLRSATAEAEFRVR